MAGSFFEFSAPLSPCGVYMCGVFVWACLWICVCGICLCGTCVWVWELMCKYRKQRSRSHVFLYHSSPDFWDRNIKHLLSNMEITNKLGEFVSKSLGSLSSPGSVGIADVHHCAWFLYRVGTADVHQHAWFINNVGTTDVHWHAWFLYSARDLNSVPMLSHKALYQWSNLPSPSSVKFQGINVKM